MSRVIFCPNLRTSYSLLSTSSTIHSNSGNVEVKVEAEEWRPSEITAEAAEELIPEPEIVSIQEEAVIAEDYAQPNGLSLDPGQDDGIEAEYTPQPSERSVQDEGIDADYKSQPSVQDEGIEAEYKSQLSERSVRSKSSVVRSQSAEESCSEEVEVNLEDWLSGQDSPEKVEGESTPEMQSVTDSEEDSSRTEEGESTAKKRRSQEVVVDDLLCPIDLELPFDPVMAEDGRIYEREAIFRYFLRNPEKMVKSPMTCSMIGKRLFPAYQTKNHIATLIEQGIITGDLARRWKQKEEASKWKEVEGKNKAEALESLTTKIDELMARVKGRGGSADEFETMESRDDASTLGSFWFYPGSIDGSFPDGRDDWSALLSAYILGETA